MTTTTISPQTVTLTGAVHGPGTVAIDADAALLAKGSIATAMTFLAASGTLETATPSILSGAISGFVAGDTIEFVDKAATGFSYSTVTDVLTVTGAAGTLAKLHFAGSYTTASFASAPDGHGGTFITHT